MRPGLRKAVTAPLRQSLGNAPLLSDTDLTFGTASYFRHARESGHPGIPIPCLPLWTPAFARATRKGRRGQLFNADH
jgi:hypothetical protein